MKNAIAARIKAAFQPRDDLEGLGTIGEVLQPKRGVLQLRVIDARSSRPRYFEIKISEPVS